MDSQTTLVLGRGDTMKSVDDGLDEYDKPLTECLFKGDADLRELKQPVPDAFFNEAGQWFDLRMRKGDIGKIDPCFEDLFLELSAANDNADLLEKRVVEKKVELEELPTKLDKAATAMLQRQLDQIRSAGCEGAPEDSAAYKKQCDTINTWKSDKHQIAQKALLALQDELNKSLDDIKEVAAKAIVRAHGQHVEKLDKKASETSSVPVAPLMSTEIPNGVDPVLFAELSALDLCQEVGTPF